jgi:hypothetical protein
LSKGEITASDVEFTKCQEAWDLLWWFGRVFNLPRIWCEVAPVGFKVVGEIGNG